MEMPYVAEVAGRRGEVLTRNAASERPASTADMSSAKAADVSATAKPADVSTATKAAAHMSATAETVATTEATTVSTPTVSTTTSAAARKRISGQPGGESDSRRQDDHGLT
jgi:hypothetical protein